MCCPFHQNEDDWWRYWGTWSKVLHLSATVDDPTSFVSGANRILADMGLEGAFVSSDSVAGEEHLLVCALHALRCRERGSAITRSPGMETLLFVAGSRHVEKALATAGLQGGNEFWMIVFCPADVKKPTAEDVAAALGAECLPKEWRTEGAAEGLERAALVEALSD